MAISITLRNARTTIENAIADQMYLAYGVRLPAAADITALRALASAGTTDRSLRYVTSKALTYQWKRFSTATDDGDTTIQPSDVLGSNPGRWIKTTSTVSSGYLKRCEPYNDDHGNLDTIESQLFGNVPAVLIAFDRCEKEPKSTSPGSLYWAKYHFTLMAVSVSMRGAQSARQGSQVAAEAAIDPGTAAMIGDAMSNLAGSDLGIDDVAYVEIADETPVVEDESQRRFVESLELIVYATLTNPDVGDTALGDPYEFNMQLQLADENSGGTYDASNYVSTEGLRFALGDGLTQSFSGGTVYLAGIATTVTGASHTFGANKVIYRDVSAAGSLTYTEVDYGANAPAVGYGLTRLGVTFTDGTGVRLDRLLLSSLVAFGPSNKIDAPAISSIDVTPHTVSVAHGTPLQFTATATYTDSTTADISDLVTWSSSNTSVATLDVTGLCTTIIAGTSNITATKDGIPSNTAALTVT